MVRRHRMLLGSTSRSSPFKRNACRTVSVPAPRSTPPFQCSPSGSPEPTRQGNGVQGLEPLPLHRIEKPPKELRDALPSRRDVEPKLMIAKRRGELLLHLLTSLTVEPFVMPLAVAPTEI
jgi:hypothetical protein